LKPKKTLFRNIEIDPKLQSQVTSIEKDFSKAVSESLKLWLRTKIPICPFNNDLCENRQCNNCAVLKKEHLDKYEHRRIK